MATRSGPGWWYPVKSKYVHQAPKPTTTATSPTARVSAPSQPRSPRGSPRPKPNALPTHSQMRRTATRPRMTEAEIKAIVDKLADIAGVCEMPA